MKPLQIRLTVKCIRIRKAENRKEIDTGKLILRNLIKKSLSLKQENMIAPLSILNYSLTKKEDKGENEINELI